MCTHVSVPVRDLAPVWLQLVSTIMHDLSAHIGTEVEMKAIEARFQVGKWTPFSTEKGTGVNNHL